GTCWYPGGTVSISMLEDPNIDQPTTITAAVGDDGTFTNSTGFSPDMNDRNVQFYVTATEPGPADANGNPTVLTAQTSFHDSASANLDKIGNSSVSAAAACSAALKFAKPAPSGPFPFADNICVTIGGAGSSTFWLDWVPPGGGTAFTQAAN